ncbi:MAG: hypothetical protein Fur0019_07170 [Tibeticola sp.]
MEHAPTTAPVVDARRAAAADLLVIDLTARVGSYALQQLHAPAVDTRSRWWHSLPLGNFERPNLDWWRPQQPSELSAVDLTGREPVMLIGPGALGLLDAWLALQTTRRLRTHAYTMPSALMEQARLQAAAVSTHPGLYVHALPSSQEQAVWLCLIEQFNSLLARRGAGVSISLEKENPMPNLDEAMTAGLKIEGATAIALVDHRSGMLLAHAGGGLNLELAAAGNSEVVTAKMRTTASLGLRESIEDILITLSTQYHIIRLLPQHPGLFLYLVLDRQRGNLALARYRLAEIERAIRV